MHKILGNYFMKQIHTPTMYIPLTHTPTMYIPLMHTPTMYIPLIHTPTMYIPSNRKFMKLKIFDYLNTFHYFFGLEPSLHTLIITCTTMLSL
jgi:hypothetical protein